MRWRLDPQEAVLGWNLNQFGEMLTQLGEYERSRVMQERALAIHEAAYAPQHTYVAFALSDLGDLFMEPASTRRPGADHFARALRIREALEPDHPYLAWALNHYARALARTGDREQARQHCERAIGIREKRANPSVAHPLANLAALLVERGDLATARPLYERALEPGGDRALPRTPG